MPRQTATIAPPPSHAHAAAGAGTPRPLHTHGPIGLVAIDLDGTLLSSDKVVSGAATRAIAATRKKGVRVVLASARPPRSVRAIYEHLRLDTFQINYNGALIQDPSRRRYFFHQPISAALALSVTRFARKLDPGVAVSIEILDKWYTDRVDPTLPTETSRKFDPDFIGPLDAIIRTPVTKLLLLGQPNRLEKVRKALGRKFAGKVTLAVSDNHLIQVMHPHADKGIALARIADHYGVPQHQVMAIGDATNDLGMLRYAGLAVAVENAWPRIRAAAHALVPSNDDHGVSIALERFILAPSATDGPGGSPAAGARMPA